MTNIPGQRQRNDHLTETELRDMRKDIVAGYSTPYVADKYRCSGRIVSKYRSLWLAGGSVLRGRRLDQDTKKYYETYHAGDARPKWEAKPHMMPGLTKEMLMGGRAPVARGGRS